MPGLISHYICGEAVLNTLDETRKKPIEKYRQIYNVGTQGPDIFFYYLPGIVRKHTRDLGTKMHKTNTGLFIKSQIEHVKSLKGEERDAALSYLCGYLSHYALDYNSHPYIYYNTGFRKNGIKDMKYSFHHRNFETAIDVLLLKLFKGEKPADKKLWQLISVKKKQSMSVVKMLSHSIDKAYSVQIQQTQVFMAIQFMVYLTRLMQSRHGRRKNLLSLAENLFLGEHVYSALIHSQEIDDDFDYLNLKKRTWHLPWNKEENDKSFPEMYNKAVEDASMMINKLFLYLEGSISIDELNSVVGNYSLASGVDCDSDVEFKYYKLYAD